MAKVMPKRRLENIGLTITGACVALVALVVITLIFMVAQQGLTTFFVDGFDPIAFLTGTHWIPEQDMYGALPMIVGSFSVTLLSTIIALPIALGLRPVSAVACSSRSSSCSWAFLRSSTACSAFMW